jgi:hypothetical protein
VFAYDGAWVEVQELTAFDFGAAYVFRRIGGTWVQADKLLPDPGAWTAFVGWDVALDGDMGVFGAHGENMQRGAVYVHEGMLRTDCNANGLADTCDILKCASADDNGDGVPDECACPWDLDASGDVGIVDFLALLAAWGANPGHAADLDGDGVVGITDFLDLLGHWGRCPPAQPAG